ncbi:MAG TPA: ABC transporter permease [Gemmataceae bacterium]|nr:ABC transporter permease [Gemmataceae bacterium]
MSIVWALVKKELRLVLRDPVALILLFVLPLLFILVFGLFVGDSFGQKPDKRLRISLVDLDHGSGLNKGEPWSHVVRRDLAETANIRIEIIDSPEEAERLIHEHKRAAILVFQSHFSERINDCSFLADGLNPFHRDGVYLDKVDVQLWKDEKQPATAAVIEQVVQVSLLRVILPWMIGRAFERLSDPEFIQLLGEKVNLPVPKQFPFNMLRKEKIKLGELLKMASSGNPDTAQMYKKKVGDGVQAALAEQFKKYNLRGKTWASLTKSSEDAREGAEVSSYENREGSGPLRYGGEHYKYLVPMFVVMFVFFLVLIAGWVFVAERRQGTLRRLQTAPLTRGHILMGKMVPCFALSVGQTLFLLIASRWLFGVRWGPDNWPLGEQLAWLLPVVLSTSLAAMGLALLIAAVARSELQVAIYGGLLVLVLAVVGGCVLPREMMPETTQFITLLTPQGWALDAYRELLGGSQEYQPNTAIIVRSCGVLAALGAASLGLASWLLRLD